MGTKLKKTPWSESASELYRPSDRRLSAKWLPAFVDRGEDKTNKHNNNNNNNNNSNSLLQSFFLVLANSERPITGEYWKDTKQKYTTTTLLHGLSPRANYTDRATASSRRSVANLCG
jgi:hypothetical protein